MRNSLSEALRRARSAWRSTRPVLLRQRRALQAVLGVLILLATAWGLWRLGQGQYWQDGGRLLTGLYVMPMYLLAPWWACVKLSDPPSLYPRGILTDVLAVGIAASRTVTPVIPASGHVVFLVYSLLTTRSRWYFVPAAAFLLFTLVVKLAVWQDFASPTTGALVALGLWRLRGSRPAAPGDSRSDAQL